VLVAQDERLLGIYRRADGGDGLPTAEVHRDGDRFTLPTVAGTMTAAEIYDRILDAAGRSLLR
jgi:hypothetical protein